MRVRATRLGIYNHRRYRPGEEFDLLPRKGKFYKDKEGHKAIVPSYEVRVQTPEEQFSPHWMERVEDEDGAPRKRRKKEPDVQEMIEDADDSGGVI